MKNIIIFITLFVSNCYGECSKNEMIKLIDKGFNKAEISNICSLSKEVNTSKKMLEEWITLKNSTCRSKGGKLVEGICSATWKDAKDICTANWGRLPTMNELKKVILDCGGILGAYSENKENFNYQECYERKGFFTYDSYWSSITFSGGTKRAWYVYFPFASQKSDLKMKEHYFRCIR